MATVTRPTFAAAVLVSAGMAVFSCSETETVDAASTAGEGGSLGSASGGSASGGDAASGGTPGGASSGGSTGHSACRPPSGIEFGDVRFNQGVASPLVEGGVWVPPDDRSVPLVVGRPVLLQSSWRLVGDAPNQPIEARLTIREGDEAEEVLTTSMVFGEPDWSRLDGVVSFELPAEKVTAATSFRLEYCTTSATSDAGVGARSFPAEEGLHPLLPWPDAMKIRVMIVPASTNCAAAPTLDAAKKEIIENYIYNLMPVAEVDVRYHEPIHISDSCGEGNVMSILADLREAEDLGPEWYYQAHFSNASNTSSGGYGWVFEDDGEVDAERVSWVQYWAGEVPMNVVHELGHNHGSDHTYASDAYPPYVPAAGKDYGGRAEFGYALRAGTHPWVPGDIGGRLLPPTIDPSGVRVDNGEGQNFYDTMSYDQPYWVGSFSYSEWARRIAASNRWSSAGAKAPKRTRIRISVGEGGRLHVSRGLGAPIEARDTITIGDGTRQETLPARIVRDGHGSVGAVLIDAESTTLDLSSGSLEFIAPSIGFGGH